MNFKFQAFHPYLSFGEGKNYFVQPDGAPSFSGWDSVSHPTEMTDDALDLWRLGKSAFDSLQAINSKDEFDDLCESIIKIVRSMRFSIGERLVKNEKAPIFVDHDGERISPDLDDLSDSTIIDITWQLTQAAPVNMEVSNILRACFLFKCLNAIDNSIIGMCLDGRCAVSSAIEAAQAFSNSQVIESGSDSLNRARSKFAAESAMSRYKKDPKQKEKMFVRECWEAWQKEPSKYGGKAKFAKDMLTKCVHLESQKKIEDWCRSWEVESLTLPAK